MSAPEKTLRQLEEGAGARFGEWFGVQLPSEFAGVEEEYRAARETVAIIDKNYRACFSFTGPDRVRYLNAILTSNIRDLAEGQCAPSLFLNAQGHILAEMEVWALADRLIAVSYAMVRETLAAQFDKYIIMDDVTLEDQTESTGVLALEGPATPIALRELCDVDLDLLGELDFCQAKVAGVSEDGTSVGANAAAIPCRVQRRTPRGVPSAEFTVERANLPALWVALTACASRHGGQPIGYAALSALRLEAGIPWFGYDFDETALAHEAGLENSHISYSKGCYLGQEIVERVRSRGRVNRHLALVQFLGDVVPPRGVELRGDEQPAETTQGAEGATAAATAIPPAKAAGHITRAAWSHARKGPLAMAYLRREFLAPGTKIRWEHGEGAVMCEVTATPPDAAGSQRN